MRLLYRFLCHLWLLLPLPSLAADLVMVYPERGKPPFIAEAPAADGIYLDILEAAARKIGLGVRVERMPKRRMLQEMQAGLVDIYPGSFTVERIPYMLWMANGLHTREVCLARHGIPDFHTPEQAPPLRVLAETGSSKETISKEYPQLRAVVMGARIDIPQALRLLRDDRGDLFFIEREPLSWYLQQQGIKSLRELGVQILGRCGEPEYAQLFGIARQSRHVREVPNPAYRPEQPPSPDNLPTMLDSRSKAGQLAGVLQAMQQSGDIDRIVHRYLADYQSWPVNLPAAAP